MGCCISKCKPKKKLKENHSNHIHDKLVISQDRPISEIIITSEKALSPAPSSSSAASFSSFSCNSNNPKCPIPSSTSSSSSSSSSSCASSLLIASKDRSFSNEFLWSCVKDNPHIVGLFPKETIDQNLDPLSFVASPKVKQLPIQEKGLSAIPKKRARASSPNLVRQKSYRKEHNFSSANSMPNNRGLRSPSPSRRLSNGDHNIRGFSTKHATNIVSKGSSVNPGLQRESFRASTPSPNRDLTISRNFSVRKRDAFSQQVRGQEMDIVMEDINNPLIALDCFIFL